ncbi:MAG: hypothetical protein LBU70_05180 [Chitinispirillales bacterium]|nr:hypothetical protein [Chitinispirillales bacterium]
MKKTILTALLPAILLLTACGDGTSTFRLRIDADPQEGGTVLPQGSIRYPAGSAARVTAVANDGYVFTGWAGAATGANLTVTVMMNGDRALTANFEKLTPTFTDPRDGKAYGRVTIGGKVWMAENLHYATGNSWCYDNDESNCQTYGRLYDWNTAMAVCPEGWRLPTDSDWNDLVSAVGGREVAGGKLKSKTGWDDGGNGDDDFGFAAMPGGVYIPIGVRGRFHNIGTEGSWWTTTEGGRQASGPGAFRWRLRSGYASADAVDNDQSQGYSVRCIMN